MLKDGQKVLKIATICLKWRKTLKIAPEIYPNEAAKRPARYTQMGSRSGPKIYPNGVAKRPPRYTQMGSRSGPQDIPKWFREAAPRYTQMGSRSSPQESWAKIYLNGASKRPPTKTQMGLTLTRDFTLTLSRTLTMTFTLSLTVTFPLILAQTLVSRPHLSISWGRLAAPFGYVLGFCNEF